MGYVRLMSNIVLYNLKALAENLEGFKKVRNMLCFGTAPFIS